MKKPVPVRLVGGRYIETAPGHYRDLGLQIQAFKQKKRFEQRKLKPKTADVERGADLAMPEVFLDDSSGSV